MAKTKTTGTEQKANGVALRLGVTDRRLDVEACSQGIEKECPFRRGFFVTILPGLAFNARYHRAQLALADRIRAARATRDTAIRKDKDAAEESGDVLRMEDRFFDPQFVVDALVADMRGLYDADGEEIEYTPEVGLRVLSDPAHADVLNWIGTEAHDYARYYSDQLEDDLGNSRNGSSGRKAGAASSAATRS